MVHFTYVDPGPNTGITDFVNHLRIYGPLFSRLREVNLLYVYQSSDKWRRGKELFEGFIRSGCRNKVNDAAMLKYFQIREAWESRQYEKVGGVELTLLGQGRKKYSGAGYEAFYQQWKRGERHLENVHLESRAGVPTCRFETYRITEKYSIFGDLD